MQYKKQVYAIYCRQNMYRILCGLAQVTRLGRVWLAHPEVHPVLPGTEPLLLLHSVIPITGSKLYRDSLVAANIANHSDKAKAAPNGFGGT